MKYINYKNPKLLHATLRKLVASAAWCFASAEDLSLCSSSSLLELCMSSANNCLLSCSSVPQWWLTSLCSSSWNSLWQAPRKSPKFSAVAEQGMFKWAWILANSLAEQQVCAYAWHSAAILFHFIHNSWWNFLGFSFLFSLYVLFTTQKLFHTNCL